LDDILTSRIAETDAFYADLQKDIADEDSGVYSGKPLPECWEQAVL
jgi:hypothetical protein